MFTTLVLAGGGWNGLLSIGALIHIFETCDLKQIQTFVGTSSGAIIGYLLCIGYELYEIVEDLFNMRLYDLFSKTSAQNYLSLWQDKYIYNFFETIGQVLEDMTLKKLRKVPTMQELYNLTSKDFVCYSYNMYTHESTKISKQSHPNLSCIKALQMTCSVPLMFNKCLYNDELYIDGGIIENFPLSKEHDDPNTLGIVLDYNPTSPENDTSIAGYLWELFAILHKKIHAQKLAFVNGACILKLCTKTSGIGKIDIRKILQTVAHGYVLSKTSSNRNFILV